jgi:hypothetical protein
MAGWPGWLMFLAACLAVKEDSCCLDVRLTRCCYDGIGWLHDAGACELASSESV